MPMSRKGRKLLKEALKKVIHRSGTVYECGSGWGHVAFCLSALFPKSKVTAVEVSPVPWGVSLLQQRIFYRRNNLYFKKGDFFLEPLSDACLIFTYLYPKAMERLKEKFEKELPEGALVVSYVFSIPGWKPLQTLTVPDIYRSKLYFYQVSHHPQ